MIFQHTKTAVSLAVAIQLCGCVSATKIESAPPGATLYINDEKTGVTPYAYSDKRIIGTDVRVKMKKEGYEDLEVSFSRSEEPDIGPIIGGVFTLVPFLWAMKYKPVHTYELEPIPVTLSVVPNPPAEVEVVPAPRTKTKSVRKGKKSQRH